MALVILTEQEIEFEEVNSEVHIPASKFHVESVFAHCKTRFKFKNILKTKIKFEDTIAQVDVLNDSLAKGQSFFVKPDRIGILETRERTLKESREYNVFMRPPPKRVGVFEPRIYNPGVCSQIVISKLGTVKMSSAPSYALYLLEISKEMLDASDSAFLQNKFGLGMHFARYSLEFSAKSIFPVADSKWTSNEHDVSRILLNDKRVARTFKSSSVTLDEIAWYLSLWASPPRMDLYGNPDTYSEPFVMVPQEEVEIVRKRAREVYNTALENFELNLLKP